MASSWRKRAIRRENGQNLAGFQKYTRSGEKMGKISPELEARGGGGDNGTRIGHLSGAGRLWRAKPDAGELEGVRPLIRDSALAPKTGRFPRPVFVCPKPGSNRHVFKGHWILSPARLPIPPFGLVGSKPRRARPRAKVAQKRDYSNIMANFALGRFLDFARNDSVGTRKDRSGTRKDRSETRNDFPVISTKRSAWRDLISQER